MLCFFFFCLLYYVCACKCACVCMHMCVCVIFTSRWVTGEHKHKQCTLQCAHCSTAPFQYTLHVNTPTVSIFLKPHTRIGQVRRVGLCDRAGMASMGSLPPSSLVSHTHKQLYPLVTEHTELFCTDMQTDRLADGWMDSRINFKLSGLAFISAFDIKTLLLPGHICTNYKTY